jgi:D-beta-D-heptose 7-phosphate kinase/D-beta-D-heptose 1-phosphate adenosyltransferase
MNCANKGKENWSNGVLEYCYSLSNFQHSSTPILQYPNWQIRKDLLQLYTIDKIVTLEKLVTRLKKVRNTTKKIVFTNGCFDIMHVGHVRYLADARSRGAMLIVGLNSDASVRLIKGDKRPIVRQDHRAEVLASLACVDHIVLFEEPDPLRLIEAIKPDILVKGEDWETDAIIGAEDVRARGGEIARISFVEETSTTGIIQTILERYRGD